MMNKKFYKFVKYKIQSLVIITCQHKKCNTNYAKPVYIVVY